MSIQTFYLTLQQHVRIRSLGRYKLYDYLHLPGIKFHISEDFIFLSLLNFYILINLIKQCKLRVNKSQFCYFVPFLHLHFQSGKNNHLTENINTRPVFLPNPYSLRQITSLSTWCKCHVDDPFPAKIPISFSNSFARMEAGIEVEKNTGCL